MGPRCRHQNFLDPTTGLPHPVTRIENAIKTVKASPRRRTLGERGEWLPGRCRRWCLEGASPGAWARPSRREYPKCTSRGWAFERSVAQLRVFSGFPSPAKERALDSAEPEKGGITGGRASCSLEPAKVDE
jgi:hypothetical protein